MRITFGGIDNQQDPQAVGPDALVICVNSDHRDDKSLCRRQGYTATALAGTNLHSLWGNGDSGFVADGTSLYHLDADLGATLVGIMPNGLISYAAGDGETACITPNGVKIVAGTSFVTSALPAPLDDEDPFIGLTSSWGGRCGAYYRGRLYVGSGSSLLFALPGRSGLYNERDYILPIGFPVLQVFAVEDGLWACGATQSAFLSGLGPDDFIFRQKPDFGAFAGSPITLSDWGREGTGPAYAAHSTLGTVLLLAGGQSVDVSGGKYRPPVGDNHHAIVYQGNGYLQLLTCFTYVEDGVRYVPNAPTVR